jgi:hypothetical protein
MIGRTAPVFADVTTGLAGRPATARALVFLALTACVFIPLFALADHARWLPKLDERGTLTLTPDMPRPARGNTAPGNTGHARSGRAAPAKTASRDAAVGSGHRSVGLNGAAAYSARRGPRPPHLVAPAARGSSPSSGQGGAGSATSEPTQLQPAIVRPEVPAAAPAPEGAATAAVGSDATVPVVTSSGVSATATVAGQTTSVAVPSVSTLAVPVGGLP